MNLTCYAQCILQLTECLTKDGEACVFPFTYFSSAVTSTTYTGCAPKDVTDQHSDVWCATKVDATGSLIFGHSGDCVLKKNGGHCRKEGKSEVSSLISCDAVLVRSS